MDRVAHPRVGLCTVVVCHPELGFGNSWFFCYLPSHLGIYGGGLTHFPHCFTVRDDRSHANGRSVVFIWRRVAAINVSVSSLACFHTLVPKWANSTFRGFPCTWRTIPCQLFDPRHWNVRLGASSPWPRCIITSIGWSVDS